MEDVGVFYGHLVHLMVFYYIFRTFGTVRGNLVYFSRFGILFQEKSSNPGACNPICLLSLCFMLRTKKSFVYGTSDGRNHSL
jgi:hypothetical protein